MAEPNGQDSNLGANLLAVAVLGILGILIVPLPGLVLDALLAVSLSAAILILLVSLRVSRPLDFSVFPALLLLITLFRLGLNVATTRLILMQGGQGGAGNIIKAFGQFAVGGSVIVGAVVFLILLIVNFSVITKGSGRISEVAARFTLDALPGKQMSIDADLAAGAITDAVAKARRHDLARETEFFGAMDGASKFVRGDAVAGLIITAINVVGGLLAGLIRDHMSLSQAVETYTILTIGDGLVSQMPALIISTAAGIIVTRAGSGGLGSQLGEQFLGNAQALFSVAGVLGVVSLMPGMPSMVLLFLAGAAVYLGMRARKRAQANAAEPPTQKITEVEENVDEMLAIDAIEVELGMGLVRLIDADAGGELPGRVTALRKQIAADLGIVLPPVHLKDSLAIDANSYRVSLRGMECATGAAWYDRLMALDAAGNEPNVDGVSATEPTFGLPARWIKGSDRPIAEAKGYTLIDAASVITTHLGELLRKNAHELTGRQEIQELLNVAGREAPKLVEDVVPGAVTLGELGAVVRGLLREGISVRDFRSLLEAVADASARSKDEGFLIDQARLRLRRQITQRVADEKGQVHALTLDRAIESNLRSSLGQSDGQVVLAPDVDVARGLIDSLEQQAAQMAASGLPTVVLAPPDLRRPLFSFASRFIPDLWVVSARELVPGTSVDPVGTVGIPQLRSAA